MYRDDRLPDYLNDTIAYRSYPPANACWIYFILKIFGYGEGNVLFVQGAWILACAISSFELNKTKDKLDSMLIGICIMSSMYWVDTLLVDVILALSTVAAMIIIYEYRCDVQK